jgi:hypothetical protein
MEASQDFFGCRLGLLSSSDCKNATQSLVQTCAALEMKIFVESMRLRAEAATLNALSGYVEMLCFRCPESWSRWISRIAVSG